jgi:medium-chain acyl-[acyl-carrier-protein] hydrolase
MSGAPASSWVITHRPHPAPSVRLFCFPYAGAGALAFRGWAESLPAEIGVSAIQLPGRETRFWEPPVTDLSVLVDVLVRTLYPYYLLSPFAFFGHSLGALIAFELARELRRLYNVAPVHLFASGRLAPQERDPRPTIYDLPDEEFIAMLRTLDGTPEEIFQAPELLAQLIPVLRADLALNETYAYTTGAPLDTPITALGGDRDPKVSVRDLEAWVHQTSGAFAVRMFDGGHFFIHTARRPVLRVVAQELDHLLV